MHITVGIIGLGPMGGNIARILLSKNFSVAGFDIKVERMKPLGEAGMVMTQSTFEVADKADVLITSLPSVAALQVVTAEILKSQKTNQVIVETSTLALQEKLSAYQKFKSGGRIMLDCPISGTPSMLVGMTAAIYGSGDEDAYRKCLSVFEGFTATNYFVGEIGNGTKMKLLANYLVHVHTTAAAECMVMGQKAGLDPESIYKTLKSGAGGSKMFDIRGAMMAKSDYREGGGTMFAIYEKDSGIITDFAASVKAPIDLYVSSRQKMNSAMALGLGHLDTSAVCKAIEVAVGIDRKLAE
ncbi:MAG TPA: NAD(P)-dependent oxidoreductase [Gammaproteobacteria bacterium]|nr:NAD(P)-dependent oxidoreductase [Gammaproteobacteria bacterium]